MLVLGRYENEAILIDGRIKVVIVAIEGNRVQVGIEAPREIPIVRAELASKRSPYPVETTEP